LTKDSSATIGAPLASLDSAANTAGGSTPSSVFVTIAAVAGERLDGGLYGGQDVADEISELVPIEAGIYEQTTADDALIDEIEREIRPSVFLVGLTGC
jgi:hypothetical protein